MRRVSQTLPQFKDKRDHCEALFHYGKYFSLFSDVSPPPPPLWLNSRKNCILLSDQGKGIFTTERGRAQRGRNFVEEMKAKKAVYLVYSSQ